jgi:hypothetical protein
MLPVVQRFFRIGPLPFEWPRLERAGFRRGPIGAHYAKQLAAVITWTRDYLQWEGHRMPEVGRSQVQLERALDLLSTERWQTGGDERDTLDAAIREVERILDETNPDTWDAAARCYRLDPIRQEQLRAAVAQHPTLPDALRRARTLVEQEARQHQRRGERLDREMREGGLPLPEKLRRAVSEWRRRGLLPPRDSEDPE